MKLVFKLEQWFCPLFWCPCHKCYTRIVLQGPSSLIQWLSLESNILGYLLNKFCQWSLHCQRHPVSMIRKCMTHLLKCWLWFWGIPDGNNVVNIHIYMDPEVRTPIILNLYWMKYSLCILTLIARLNSQIVLSQWLTVSLSSIYRYIFM